MSEASPYRAEDGIYEQLVAYLDGELDAEHSQEVERRLAADEGYRRELQQLQHAWDLLDELPKSEVSETFTQSTVEMVVLSTSQELELHQSTAVRQYRRWWRLGGVSLLGAALASFGAVFFLLRLPNERLVRDLSVIERIDLYRHAESIDYLRQLHESGLFGEEIEDAL